MIHHLPHEDLAALLAPIGGVDALIVDAPYSARTHGAHDVGTADLPDGSDRREIDYSFWTPEDVTRFVEVWHPLTAGWIVSLTDTNLAPAWTAALEATGRYVFSPVACVEPGSRVRVAGDGPAQWSVWAIVARPRREPFSKWGSLPGAYVVPKGQARARASSPVVGGKSSWLMERLVCDYSRPGDLVCDPCCGAGTTIRAALAYGRRAVGGDVSAEHVAIARGLLASGVQSSWCA
jgi:hypothetical protein